MASKSNGRRRIKREIFYKKNKEKMEMNFPRIY